MTVLFPGSFDPVTWGHVDIVRRAVAFSRRLIVAVLDNPHKQPLFTAAERVALLKEVLHGGDNEVASCCLSDFLRQHETPANIEIAAYSGLLAEYAQQRGAMFIIRGVRDSEDYNNEARYAWHNRLMNPGKGIETLFIPASPEHSFISSRIVREAAGKAAYDVLGRLVPDAVCTAMRIKFTTKG